MKTVISAIDEKSLSLAKEILNGGGLVAFPTETVYGLGAVATDTSAVKAIFEAKGRPSDNPLIVHVHEGYDITSLVYIDHAYVYDLIKAFTPGPLTMVFRSRGVVSPAVSCGLDTLAVRIPSDENARAFLRFVNAPIAAPSANASKHVSPVTAMHVYEDLCGRIPPILDGGRCTGGIESTVLDVTEATPRILRSGLVTCDMIKSVAGDCVYAQHKEGDKVKSPGVKYKHYSPKCRTAFFKRTEVEGAIQEYKSALKQGFSPIIICDDGLKQCFGDCRTVSLGLRSEELAANVYNALRECEKAYDYIIGIELEGDSQIDVGVMNRFEKACKE